MNARITLLVAAVAVVGPVLAVAQDSASQDLMQANQSMMDAMSGMQMSGNPDMDFAMMMIPHHQGAIDMAKVELEHGADPELRAMAQEIIDAQEREISVLQDWMKAQGH